MAFAEVMDKVAPVSSVWQSAVVMSIIGLAAGRIHPALGLILVLLPTTVISALYEVHDPYVGPAIASEAASAYTAHVYGANAAWLAAYLVGCIWWWMRRKARAKLAKNPPTAA
jgi:hypothetical protein